MPGLIWHGVRLEMSLFEGTGDSIHGCVQRNNI